VPGEQPPKFRFTVSAVKELFYRAGVSWSEDRVPRLSAAFSFYAVLSLSPLLVFAVTIGSFIVTGAENRLLYEASGFVGPQGKAFLHTLLTNTTRGSAGVIATISSLAITFFSASNLFLQLDDAMNTIWDIKSTGSFLHTLVKTRVLAFFGVLVFGTLVVGWLLLDWWLRWLQHHSVDGIPWQFVSLLASTLVLMLAFGVSFKALPAGKLTWSDVWPAAILTALGFDFSKSILNMYFAYAGVSAAYGVAGALVVILLWIYYTSQIYFFGAEFASTWAHMYGSAWEGETVNSER
jgi:membrane protein